MEARLLNAAEMDAATVLIRKGAERPGINSRVHTSFAEPFIEGEDFKVQYFNRDGGFTICIIRHVGIGDGVSTWIGASRKSKNDKMNRVRGEMMAFMRAIRHGAVRL